MDSIRMNMAIAVPQVFYDLIARVLPGFLFLFMMRLWLISLNFDDVQLANIWFNFPDKFLGSLYFVITYFIFSYYMGWILSILSGMKPFYKYGVDYMISRHSVKPSKMNNYFLADKYQKIRLENENVGFRIVKLRAEAKMLEASRTGLCFMTVLMFLSFIYDFWQHIEDFHLYFADIIALLGKSLMFLIPLIMALLFEKTIAGAVQMYIGNIEIHYDLMFNEK
jgi:hypothetical protein